MKQEKLLLAMGDICDAFVLDAMQAPVKSNRRIWTKWVAVAACLCLLIAIPVAGAHSDLIVEFLSGENRWSVRSEYRFTERDFSKEVRKHGKQENAGTLYFPMESLEEAEEFLGVELPYNSSLERAVPDELHVEFEENGKRVRYEEHCLVMLHYGEHGKLNVADIWAQYRHGTSVVRIYYRMPTTNIPYKNGGGMGGFDEEAIEERYVSPCGREFSIFYTGEILNDSYGYGVIDGVLLEVEVIDRSEENVRKYMTKILDGFE